MHISEGVMVLGLRLYEKYFVFRTLLKRISTGIMQTIFNAIPFPGLNVFEQLESH
jgi:hypothetical protein